METSLIQRVVQRLGPEKLFALLSEEQRARLPYEWRAWARPKQMAPEGDWATWLVCAGRAFGKSRTGSEWVREQIESGRRRQLALIGSTGPDARGIMIEDPKSGILAVSPPEWRPIYKSSKGQGMLIWPNGAIARVFSGEEPERLRGWQHDGFWADELAAWQHPVECWNNLQFTLRQSRNPQGIVTTTPRPIDLVRDLIDDATTVVTRGSTMENAANLPPVFLERILAKYKGTRLGRQEIDAEVLEDNPNALWRPSQIDALRRTQLPTEITRIVVAVDPSITNRTRTKASGEIEYLSDEVGIVICALGYCDCRGARELHGFILDDLSGHYSAHEWARQVAQAYRAFEADSIIAEGNQGGDLVAVNVHTVDAHLPVRLVWARRGKWIRAEPIGALYEQGRVHHVGQFAELEDELTTWNPQENGFSPNRLDALVWGLTELMASDEIPELPQTLVGGKRRV